MRRLSLSIVGILLFATANAPIGSTRSLREDPSLVGQWSTTEHWGFSAVHMHVLPNGKVLMWDWEGHGNGDTPTWLWDPADLDETGSPKAPISGPTLPNAVLFCSGHAFLSDGRLFVAGGGHDPQSTVTATYFYDYSQGSVGTWTTGPVMTTGRWYPTVTALPNGEAFIGAGETPNPVANEPSLSVTRPELLTPLNTLHRPPYATEWEKWYPFQFVAPNGHVFRAGGSPAFVADPPLPTGYFNPVSGAWTEVSGPRFGAYKNYGSAVMYAPGRVLRMGGGNMMGGCGAYPDQVDLVTAEAETIDLNVTTPTWSATSAMANARIFSNATILANGHVLVTGGLGMSTGTPPGPTFARQAESWDPSGNGGNGAWTTMASATPEQGYHSSAVLLPDGRVLTSGGRLSGCNDQQAWQVFSPPYLFQSTPRPEIVSAPTEIHYGQPFVADINTVSATDVTLVRLSSTTHHFNANQRFNRLTFTQDGTSLTITPPSGANLAPPGHYLMFVFKDGVPSVAKIVRLDAAPAPVLDLNDDGKRDVLRFNPATGAWSQQITLDDGFADVQVNWAAGWSMLPAKFNSDALTDLFIFSASTGEWFKMLNTGAGFTEQATSAWWPNWQKFVMDLNGDGISDLFLYDPVTGQWYRCLSTPTGFTYVTGWWIPGWEIHPMSLNHDRLGDLFLFSRSTGQWFWVVGDADGSFTYPQTGLWETDWAFYAGDFDGDLRSDLFLYRSQAGQHYVAMNSGNGYTYTNASGWVAGWTPHVGDLDADGADDLFLYNTASGQWYELISDRLGGFSDVGSGAWSAGWNIYPTDFDSDGRTDFLLYSPVTGAWYQARNLLLGAFDYITGIPWPSQLIIIAGLSASGGG